jgi:hypothetical protein
MAFLASHCTLHTSITFTVTALMSTETKSRIFKLLAINQSKDFFSAQAKTSNALYYFNVNSILNEQFRKYSTVLKIIVRHNKYHQNQYSLLQTCLNYKTGI